MATTSSVSRRSLVVAIIMIIASGCTGSTTSTSAFSVPPTSVPSTPSDDAVQLITDTLHGGLYRFGPFGDSSSSFTIAAKGPNGWTGYPDWAMDGPEPLRADAPNGIGVAFFTANSLFSDPCHWDWKGTGQADSGDVKITDVNDTVAALRENTYYTSTAAKPVIIDGHSGKELTLQLPDDSFKHCDKDDPSDEGGHVFVFGAGLYAQGPANRWHVYVVDAEGGPLIATVLSYEKTPRTDVETAEDAVMSLHFEA